MRIWQTLRRVFSRVGDGDADGFRPGAKDASEVAKRFVLLVLVAELADSVALESAGGREKALAMRKRALDHMLSLGFTPHDLEERERSFVTRLRTGQIDGNEAMAAMWRLECAGVLAWSLGLAEAILPIDQSIETAGLHSALPTDAAALRDFAVSAALRPLPELLAAHHDWSVRWFPLEGAPPGEERSRVLERTRAIRWLCEPALHELSTTRLFSGG